MLAGVRQQLIARRTQLSNTIRGYAAEFGLTAAKGLDKIEPLLARDRARRDRAGTWRASCSRSSCQRLRAAAD